MLDPETLYTVESEPAEDSSGVLLHAMQGFVDAGSATRLAVDHLLTELDSPLVATFDADQLVDYRSRRPTMVYDRDHYSSYREPRLELHAVTDPTGREFLLLTVRGATGTEAFYAGLGYTEVARLPGILRLGPGDDREEIWMRRVL